MKEALASQKLQLQHGAAHGRFNTLVSVALAPACEKYCLRFGPEDMHEICTRLFFVEILAARWLQIHLKLCQGPSGQLFALLLWKLSAKVFKRPESAGDSTNA